MSTPAAALDLGLGWAEEQFAGPRCELRDFTERQARPITLHGRAAGDRSIPCELPATCRLVFVHQANRDPDDVDESLSCDHHREEIEARLGLGGLVGPCPHCGAPIVLDRVEPL